MALYSIELRRYIESFSQYSQTPKTIKEKIEIGQPHLFDFDYPFFDESKKKDFERKWIRRFYMTEIGFETVEAFKFHLENWMNEKMPYYNQRFKSELIDFDPLMNTVMNKQKDFTKDGLRNDNVDTIGNKNNVLHTNTHDEGSFQTNTTNDGTVHNESTGNMESDGTVDNNGTETKNETGTKKGNNKNVNDGTSFNRKLTEDTPDGRLNITTEDGKGVISYASGIEENTGKTHNDETITIDENTSRDASGNTTDKTVSHDEANSKSTSDGTSKDVGSATGTNENDGTVDTKANEDTTGNTKLDQTTNEVGNQMEYYMGKIGVETYSEMLEKYRETFIRVESEIYEECRKDLFMLVY